MVFPGGAVVKNPANAGNAGGFNPWLRKVPQRKEMVTHSDILAWEIPWTEVPGGLQSMGLQKSRT